MQDDGDERGNDQDDADADEAAQMSVCARAGTFALGISRGFLFKKMMMERASEGRKEGDLVIDGLTATNKDKARTMKVNLMEGASSVMNEGWNWMGRGPMMFFLVRYEVPAP
jgi:hypothetical protein